MSHTQLTSQPRGRHAKLANEPKDKSGDSRKDTSGGRALRINSSAAGIPAGRQQSKRHLHIKQCICILTMRFKDGQMDVSV